jgi:hypothetical protein
VVSLEGLLWWAFRANTENIHSGANLTANLPRLQSLSGGVGVNYSGQRPEESDPC